MFHKSLSKPLYLTRLCLLEKLAAEKKCHPMEYSYLRKFTSRSNKMLRGSKPHCYRFVLKSFEIGKRRVAKMCVFLIVSKKSLIFCTINIVHSTFEPETMRKLCLFAKFLYRFNQLIQQNFFTA